MVVSRRKERRIRRPARQGRPQGEGHQVAGYPDTERVCEMQSAETVLGVPRVSPTAVSRSLVGGW